MARSSYIYLAQGSKGVTLSAFTVQKECVSFLLTTHLDVLTVERHRDGVTETAPVIYSKEAFLEEAGK